MPNRCCCASTHPPCHSYLPFSYLLLLLLVVVVQVKTGKFSFMANSRARAVQDTEGMVSRPTSGAGVPAWVGGRGSGQVGGRAWVGGAGRVRGAGV